MGLFERKIDGCIAFVGRYKDVVPRELELEYALNYRERLRALSAENCGNIPIVAWFFSDWSEHVYSPETLRDVQDSGFGSDDEGEKGQLYQEMLQILILRHRAGTWDDKPVCLINADGVFVILCRVKAKPKYLGIK